MEPGSLPSMKHLRDLRPSESIFHARPVPGGPKSTCMWSMRWQKGSQSRAILPDMHENEIHVQLAQICKIYYVQYIPAGEGLIKKFEKKGKVANRAWATLSQKHTESFEEGPRSIVTRQGHGTCRSLLHLAGGTNQFYCNPARKKKNSSVMPASRHKGHFHVGSTHMANRFHFAHIL